MTLVGAACLFVIYILGLAASVAWANSLGATYLLALLLWTSFFGFMSATGLTLFWSREHWLE